MVSEVKVSGRNLSRCVRTPHTTIRGSPPALHRLLRPGPDGNRAVEGLVAPTDGTAHQTQYPRPLYLAPHEGGNLLFVLVRLAHHIGDAIDRARDAGEHGAVTRV